MWPLFDCLIGLANLGASALLRARSASVCACFFLLVGPIKHKQKFTLNGGPAWKSQGRENLSYREGSLWIGLILPRSIVNQR